jgi:hypothetical protein
VGDLQGGPPSGEFALVAPIDLFGPLRDVLVAARTALG